MNQRLNVTAIAEDVGTTPLSPDWSYAYDGISRLTAATSYPTVPAVPSLPASDAFPYDAAGNRDDDPGTGSPWRYDANNRIEESPELLYAFDADGNLCKWAPSGGSITTGCAAGDTDETRFVFDSTSRLRAIHRPDDGVPGPTNPEVTYRYDPFGRRLEKTVNGVTTWFVWDGDQLLGEYDASGGRTARYAYAGGYAPMQVAYPDGSGEDVHEVHTDHLATPRMLTDPSGSAVWRGYLEAYGEAHVDSSIDLRVRFPGQYYDEETEVWDPTLAGGSGGFVPGSGLHYNRWRYYDASRGSYVRGDPIGQQAGLNLYNYAGNNPALLADPMGSEPRPAPPSRTKTRECNAGEMALCTATCGSKGVQSCRAVQTFRVTRSVTGFTVREWVDGPMSCSCNEPDPTPNACPAFGQALFGAGLFGAGILACMSGPGCGVGLPTAATGLTMMMGPLPMPQGQPAGSGPNPEL